MSMFEEKNQPLTPISELGEFGLIELIKKQIKLSNPTTVDGIGDDAAQFNHKGENSLITTDMLIEGVHFDLSYTPLKHLGYKAVSVNVSDIYAMNGTPSQITVSMALSNRFPVEAVDELYEGIMLACERYGVDLVGGDTTSSRVGLVLSITAIGSAKAEDVVKRSGAKPTDLLVLTGDIGGAYLGLQVLEREKAVFKENPNLQPDLAQYPYILERQLKPEARKDIIPLLKELDLKPTSMIDVSDGLSSELIHICKSSGVGCRVYEDKIPLDPETIKVCEEFNVDSTTMAINGGEDYELLFTIPLSDFDKIKGNPHFTPIGHITEEAEGMVLQTRDGTSAELTAKGWDSFLKKEK